jgi:hypothetical protein
LYLEINDLKTNGFEVLNPVDISKIDFLKISKINSSNKVQIENTIVDIKKGEEFARNNNFHKITKKYFNQSKVNFNIVSWHTKSFTNRNEVKTTSWHRDRDGYKVLKFFIYLTDVNKHTGPHEYAIKTHIIKPIKYVPQIRYLDRDVENNFQIKTFLGPRGSCFVVDTSGLHKGTPPITGHRTILQFVYYTGPIYWSEKTLFINL